MTNLLEKIIIEPKEKPAQATIIWLHGLGADGHDFTGIIPALNLPSQSKIRFIFPHAPVRSVTINNGMMMRAWFDIFELSRLEHEDNQGLRDSQILIEQLISQEIQAGISPSHIFLAGFSQGGCMALYVGLRHQHRLGGIIALSCYLPLMQQLSSLPPNANQDIPIFMAHGQYDAIIPIQASLLSRDYLHQQGYNVSWHVYHMAHEVCAEEIHDIGNWIRTNQGLS